jgi:diguanylate cyclase (GGDEF)-like protein
MTERKRMEEELLYQALHDSVTGLPNRVLLRDRLEQIVLATHRDAEPVALLLMDLDGFKEVNDTFGHHHGDLLLQQLGARLRSVIRESDTIARIGGDEFALVLPAAGEPGALACATKIQEALRAPFVVEEAKLNVRASLGAALSPPHGTDSGTLLRHADVAMYQAKRARIPFAIYNPAEDPYSPDRMRLVDELRNAISKKQLVLHYQPQLLAQDHPDLQTGSVDQVEALVRWRHPEQGLIPPGDFISLAEETGLIGSLAIWVLHAAFEHYHVWRQAGLELRVAVNLSAVNVRDPHLVDTIAGALQASKTEPSVLQLEITEGMLMRQPDQALGVLTQLRDLGVTISIDDFGTGFSSLAYLQQLPIDAIKIDRCFVTNMATNVNDAAIVRSIVELGHNLGLEVGAEGVEDRASWEMLQAYGCDRVQGHYLAAPLPLSELISWLQDAPSRSGWSRTGDKSAG